MCPEAQAGRVLAHPRWLKCKGKYPNVKFYSGRRTFGGVPRPFSGTTTNISSSSGSRIVPGQKKGVEKISIKDRKQPLKRGPNGKFQIHMVDADGSLSDESIDAVPGAQGTQSSEAAPSTARRW